jgi:DNA topoisomerase-2
LILESTENRVTYSDFINKELVHFSIADNVRSIPGIDGFKPSQRKVVYTCISKNINTSTKVPNLASMTSEYTQYHHGEVSMQNTIVNLAQNHIGTNNFNLLEPLGQFGSRLSGESARVRYIFTKMSKYIDYFFNKLDNPILEYRIDEGQQIEPVFYMPLLPFSLLNGCEGIGTGYSTFIPPFHVNDILKNTILLLKGRDTTIDMVPHFNNFTGDTEHSGSSGYVLYGTFKIINEKTLVITELPPRVLTEIYTEKFIKGILISQGIVKSYKANSTDTTVCIELTFTNPIPTDYKEIVKLLKLSTKVSCSNFHLFDSKGYITHYPEPIDILKEYIPVRLAFYAKRKDYWIAEYTNQANVLENKIRFISEIISDTIYIYKKSSKQVIDILKKAQYLEIDSGYSYLTSMQINSFTSDKIDSLQVQLAKIQKEIDWLKSKTPKEMYILELKELAEKLKTLQVQLQVQV